MDHPTPDSQNPYVSPAIPSDVEKSLPPISSNKPNEPLVEPIRMSGALSLADYHHGLQLADRSFVSHEVRLFFLILFPLLVVILCFTSEISRGGSGTAIVVLLGILIWGAGMIRYCLNKWRIRRIHAAGKGVFSPIDAILYEDYYETRDEQMNANVSWSIYREFRSSGCAAILYYDGKLLGFAIIPRSYFQTQHDWECFLGLLDRKLPRC